MSPKDKVLLCRLCFLNECAEKVMKLGWSPGRGMGSHTYSDAKEAEEVLRKGDNLRRFEAAMKKVEQSFFADLRTNAAVSFLIELTAAKYLFNVTVLFSGEIFWSTLPLQTRKTRRLAISYSPTCIS